MAVSGLVYCEVSKNGDSEEELEMVEGSLTEAIPSISRVQIGCCSRPETAYANEAGGSILRSLRRMEKDISKLQEEVTVLRPLQATAVGIRKRFFAVYLRREQTGAIGTSTTIREGNDIAHAGDVITDICLLKNGLIEYHRTFTLLYGLTWRTAIELIGRLINPSRTPLGTVLPNRKFL